MRKPVLLIGMMGCGKSTVGRLLAERMRLPLIDLDEEIARAAEKTIPEIFAQEGEAGFRARSRRRWAISSCLRWSAYGTGRRAITSSGAYTTA